MWNPNLPAAKNIIKTTAIMRYNYRRSSSFLNPYFLLPKTLTYKLHKVPFHIKMYNANPTLLFLLPRIVNNFVSYQYFVTVK